MNCEKCGEPLLRSGRGEFMTLVGYSSPPGHNHDDNCRKRTYACKNDHAVTLSIMNTCPKCDWVGKKDCFCSIKVEAWPDGPKKQE